MEYFKSNSPNEVIEYDLIGAPNHTVENDHEVVKALIAPGEVRNPGLKEIRLLVSRAGFTFGKESPVREDGNGFFITKNI